MKRTLTTTNDMKHGINIRTAKERDRKEVNVLARKSPWTRDFANPPLSLKAMCAVAFNQGEVFVAEDQFGALMGFIWCRPMKPKYMQFSTVYYMGVDPEFQHNGVAAALLLHASWSAKNNRIELVCEDGNAAASAFYRRFGMSPMSTGTVGKDLRPYTRWWVEGPL